MDTKSMPKSTDEMTDLDREILVMEHKRTLGRQEDALLTARLEIKKADRAVQKYKDTIDSLVDAIADTKAQIADLEKGGEK